VFLGIDHSFNDREPILYETFVNGNNDEIYVRYRTWAEAEAGHAFLVDFLMQRNADGKLLDASL
jgi:hypothetical protein